MHYASRKDEFCLEEDYEVVAGVVVLVRFESIDLSNPAFFYCFTVRNHTDMNSGMVYPDSGLPETVLT